jgi:hypothetical protein
MKRLTKPTLAVLLALILFGCSRNNSESFPAGDQTSELRPFRVLPIDPEQCPLKSQEGMTMKGYQQAGVYMPYSVLRSKTIASSGSLYVAII